jgi:hypothetical protein
VVSQSCDFLNALQPNCDEAVGDPTLAELGENLMRSGRGDDRDRGSTTAASAPCRPNVGAGIAHSAGKALT